MRKNSILRDARRLDSRGKGCRALGICLPILLLLSFLIQGCQSQPGDFLTAGECVNGLQAASRRMSQVQFDFEEKTYSQEPSGDESLFLSGVAHGKFARMNNRLDLWYTNNYSFAKNSKKHTLEDRFLITGDKAYTISRRPSRGNKIVGATVAPASGEAYQHVWNQGFGSFLEGHLIHAKGDWASVVGSVKDPRSLSLKAPEEVDGIRCAVLEAHTFCGEYTLWIDKDHGFVVRKARIVVGPDDYYVDGKLSDHKFGPIAERVMGRHLKLTRFECSIDHVKVTPVGDTFVASGGIMTTRMVFAEGKPMDSRHEVSRSNIRLGDDVEASKFFKLDWPEGTRAVGMDAYRGKQFVWSKGQLSPYVPRKSPMQILNDLTNSP